MNLKAFGPAPPPPPPQKCALLRKACKPIYWMVECRMRLESSDGPPNSPDGPPNGLDGPPNGPDGPDSGAGDRRLRPLYLTRGWIMSHLYMQFGINIV